MVVALVAMGMSMAVGAGRASAAGGSWVSTSTGCPSGVGTPCYVYKSPEGVVLEGGKYMSTTEFENLGVETADTVIEGGHLTSSADAVVERPSFAAEEINSAEAVDGLDGASEVETGLAAVGEIPVLGPAVLAFTAGYGIGTAICGIFGGCTDVESTEAGFESSTGGSIDGEILFGQGQWDILSSSPCSGPTFVSCNWPAAYFWAQSRNPTGYFAATDSWFYQGYGGVPVGEKSSGLVAPGLTGVDLYVEAEEGTGHHRGYAYRSVLQGRRLFSSEKAPSGFSEQTFTPSSELSKKMSTFMREPSSGDGTQAVGVARSVSSQIPGSEVTNPFPFMVRVPDCDGLLYPACARLVEEAGLNPTHRQFGWEHAVISDPAEEVEELSPSRSTQVEEGSTVTVTTNPEEGAMPVVVPAPGADETYSEYVARLNPALAPHQHLLGELTYNPSYGPNAVVGTSPVAGTRVNPSGSTSLDVQVNPETAPDVGEGTGTGTWSPPGIAAIDLAPLSSIHIGCGTFPFGIFCWLKEGLTSWGPGGTCPDISLPFVSFGSGEDHFAGAHLESSTCGFEPAMEIIRPTLVVLACISLAAMFAYAALGIGGAGGGDD